MSMSSQLRKWAVAFDCGHTRMYRSPIPIPGEELYCVDCESHTRVAAHQNRPPKLKRETVQSAPLVFSKVPIPLRTRDRTVTKP